LDNKSETCVNNTILKLLGFNADNIPEGASGGRLTEGNCRSENKDR
jgi:hypothetical protein